MQISVKNIEYNRFRDFKLNPINPDHVDVLANSIERLGFFSGITVRPLGGGKFEAAAGHHRFEAAKQAKIEKLEAVVEDYTDEQMVEIMVKENATQRGGNALATLDSVAATARIIVKQVLLGEGDSARNLALSGERFLAKAQTEIAKDGPGWSMIFEAINGFDYSDRKGKAPVTMSKTEIEVSLGQLKDSGYMGKLVSEVYAEVEAIREEERKNEEAERAKLAAQEERERKAAEAAAERSRIAEERAAKAKADAEAAAKAARENKAKAEQERAKRAAEEAESRRKAAIAALKEREQREAEAKASREAKAKRDREMAAREQKERLERQAIADQKAEARYYDLEAGQVFARTAHQQAFKTHVTSPRGQLWIPKDKQLALAKRIKADMARLEKNDDGSVEMGSGFIKAEIMEVIRAAEDAQRQVTEHEKQKVLQESDRRRVEERWERIRRAMQTVETELMALNKDLSGWQWARETFPVNKAVIRVIAGIAQRFTAMAKQMGLDL